MRRKDQVILFVNKQVATQTKTQDESVSQPQSSKLGISWSFQ